MNKPEEDKQFRGPGHAPMRFTKLAVANRVKRNNKRKNRGKGSKHISSQRSKE